MSADLTCPTCNGGGKVVVPDVGEWIEARCRDCDGTGRRRPELKEWDALKAERDRLLSWQAEAVEALRIGLDHAIAMDKWRVDAAQVLLTRAALDSEPGGSTPLMVSKHPRDHHCDTALVYDDERDSDPDLAERTRRIKADE